MNRPMNPPRRSASAGSKLFRVQGGRAKEKQPAPVFTSLSDYVERENTTPADVSYFMSQARQNANAHYDKQIDR